MQTELARSAIALQWASDWLNRAVEEGKLIRRIARFSSTLPEDQSITTRMEIDTAHGDRVVVSANTALHVDGAQDWAQPR